MGGWREGDRQIDRETDTRRDRERETERGEKCVCIYACVCVCVCVTYNGLLLPRTLKRCLMIPIACSTLLRKCE